MLHYIVKRFEQIKHVLFSFIEKKNENYLWLFIFEFY